MAYGNVPHESAGNVAQSSRYNQLVDNVDDLDTRLDTVEARTTDTATSPGGIGNQRLADRFGTGVGTTTNVTTGTATAQLTDLRSRVGTVESTTTNGTSGNSALNTRVASLESSIGSLGATLDQYASGFVSTASATAVALSGDPGVAFTAPSSGKILVTAGCRTDTNNGQVMIEVKTGSTIGSGTTFLAADTSRSGDKGSRTWLVTGLTSGGSYNVRVMYASASGTSGFAQRYIIVHPTS